jgi:PilZ domain
MGSSLKEPVMAERKPRLRTLKTGRIVFDRRTCVIDCTVRNVSAAGACLELPSTVGVPERFDLLIGPEKHPRPCRIAWKDEKRVGVTFQ